MANPNKLPVLEVFGPTIQGEGIMIGVQTTFIRSVHCDYGCERCIEENQRVLMADWSYKEISRVNVGEYVMGAIQNPITLGRLKIQPVKVTAVINQGKQRVIKVKTSKSELLCTPDHKLLNVKWRNYWQPAETCYNAKLLSLSLWETNEEFWLGWLHGMFSGDGSIHKFKDKWWRMKISMDRKDRDAILKVIEELDNIGITAREIEHDGGNGTTKLCGAEVTNHTVVECFYEDYLKEYTSADYQRGWVSGLFDTDGHMDDSGHNHSVRISQSLHCNEWKIDRLGKYLDNLGFKYNVQESVNNAGNLTRTVIVNRTAEFFTTFRPVLKRKYPKDFGVGKYPNEEVTYISEPSEDVFNTWDITTESGNFIAEGILVHNCDSKHAVEPAQYKGKERTYTAQELFDELMKIQGHCEWVTISGGNPALWDFSLFVTMCQQHGLKVAVETQGSVYKTWLSYVDQLTISPKGPGMREPKADVLSDLKAFLEQLNHDVVLSTAIKIPVFGEKDLDFAEKVCDIVRNVCQHGYILPPVYLSVGNDFLPGYVYPLDYMQHRLLKRLETLVISVMKRPGLSHAIVLPQLHVLIYGNRQLV